MSYIGRGLDAISNVEKLDNITFDGSATYALTKSSAAFTPVGANNILVSIDGVIQQGNFSVSTTNIVFDWSPTSSNTCNFILHYGTGVLNVPADGSVSAAKMAANSVDSDSYVDGSIDAVHLSANSVDSDAYVDGSIDAVHLSANSVDSDAYVDGSIDTAHIGATQVTGAKLNTDVISAQTALAAEPADTDEFMVSDGGVLKRIDYSLIKPTGAWTYLYTDTQSGQASGAVDYTEASLFTSTYDTYRIYISQFEPENDGVNLGIRLKLGTTRTTNYLWHNTAVTSNSNAYASNYSGGDSRISFMEAVGNATSEGAYGYFEYYKPHVDDGIWHYITGWYTGMNSNGYSTSGMTGGTCVDSTAPISGFTMSVTSGGLGGYKLDGYGLKSS